MLDDFVPSDNPQSDEPDFSAPGPEESVEAELRSAGRKGMDWSLAVPDVLFRLDIRFEYQRLGLKITGRGEPPSGWLACRPYFRRGNRAIVNVGRGGARGWYVEYDGEQKVVSHSFLNFAVEAERWQFKDWAAAFRHFAEQTGVLLPADFQAVPKPPPPRPRDPLLPHHRKELHDSGLTDEQIKACGIHSVSDPKMVREILRWKGGTEALGHCLAFPFLSPEGRPLGYCRLKPDRPRKIDSKTVKYESPRGKPNHVYFPPRVGGLLKDPAVALLITEGEKKAARAAQDGFACLGLVGVWGWQKPRATFRCERCQKRQRPNCKNPRCGKKTGRRELLDELATIPWERRRVFVCFDSDAVTKQEVQQAESELADALRIFGAIVTAVRLPPGPDGEKVGLDDYFMSHTPADLFALMNVREVACHETASRWAAQLAEPGLILDSNPVTSPPGALVKQVIQEAGLKRTLTVLLSHRHCGEAEPYLQGILDPEGHPPRPDDLSGWLDAEAYPQRTRDNCQNYQEAKLAEKTGFAPGAAVCPECLFREGCPYRKALAEAEQADHRIMTKRRASLDLAAAAKDTDAVFVIESGKAGDSLDLFAEPVVAEISPGAAMSGLATIAEAARGLGQQSTKNGGKGAAFWEALAGAAATLGKHVSAGWPGGVKIPPFRTRPALCEARLWGRLKHLATDPTTPGEGLVMILGAFHPERLPDGSLVRLTIAFAAGELEWLELFPPEKETDLVRIAGRPRINPPDTPVLIADPTLTAGRISADTDGSPVRDITDPEAVRVLKISQVPEHATGAQRPTAALKIIRHFLRQHLGECVGVVLHKKVRDRVAVELTEEEQARVRLVVWYREPDDLRQCQAILALGCPTPSSRHVRKRLLYSGECEAAFAGGGWGRAPWRGTTEGGQAVEVNGKRYTDPAWHNAFMEFTRGWLLKTLSEFDVPITLVSSLDLGFPLVLPPLNDIQARLLAALEDELKAKQDNGLGVSARNALTFKEDPGFRALRAHIVKTERLAQLSGVGTRCAQQHLKEMKTRRLVRWEGTKKSGGWTLAAPESEGDTP